MGKGSSKYNRRQQSARSDCTCTSTYWSHREDLCFPLRENNAVFSIIVIESHSNREILSVCLRLVTWSNELVPKPSIKEVFFDFRFLTRITGQAISSSILECLSCHGIDVLKARGQAYDGSSNMASGELREKSYYIDRQSNTQHITCMYIHVELKFPRLSCVAYQL